MSQDARLGPLVLGAGLVGSLACIGAMVLAGLGLVGAAASAGAAAMGGMGGMAGMGAHADVDAGPFGVVLRFLLDSGPVILVVSVAAVALAFALRRPVAALPTLAGGALLYWGMYGQDGPAVMYGAIALGLLVWTAVYLWLAKPREQLRTEGR